MSRVILVSSPLPQDKHDLDCDRTAQIIETIQVVQAGSWIGWPRVAVQRPQAAFSFSSDDANPRSGLGLTSAEIVAIRDGVSDRMLWPILHGRPDLVRYDAEAYGVYLAANRRLAQALCPLLNSDDLVWVHDYLHTPFAAALREAGFVGALGFLLHSPFPAPDRLAPLPKHKDFISELCRYNLVGFQTQVCLRNFRDAMRRFVGANACEEGLVGPFGKVETGVFPIPNNVHAVAQMAGSPDVERGESYLRKCNKGRQLIGSWGTLDYAQGLVERLRSFELLLEHAPNWLGQTLMVQVTTPRRQWHDESQEVRMHAEQELSRINGRFAMLDWTPIQYIHALLSPIRLAALYRAARVGLITPLSEGMSLVAKDFVAGQNPRDPGVLVFSRLAGGVEELSGALLVNPYNADCVAEALRNALEMPLEERQARWMAMMHVLRGNDVDAWCEGFLKRLAASKRTQPKVAAA